MFLVWVRTVFKDTVSSRAMSGPSRSEESSRSTSSSRSLRGSIRPCCVGMSSDLSTAALGDQIVFTTQLLKGDTEVGHQGGVCTVTSVARAEAQCLATYALPGGQIAGQALIILGDPAPYAVAITGGSGKYKGVEGEIRVDPASETQPRGVLTFHL